MKMKMAKKTVTSLLRRESNMLMQAANRGNGLGGTKPI
jgi:hypothetical protein